MYRILYIGNFNKLWDEEGIARGLEANGAEVTRVPEHEFNMALLEEHLRRGLDCILFAKLHVGSPSKFFIHDLAHKYGAITACLVPDLYWGLSREYKLKADPMFKADVVMTPDGDNREWGFNHVTMRQSIPDEYCYISEKEESKDVVFIGSLNSEYPYRTQLIQAIERRYGDRFKWYGRSNSDEVRGHKLNGIGGIHIGESVYAPFYWSNRIYEALGRGAFMIHPNIPGLKEEYAPYEHFIPYNHGDFDGLFEIVDYYTNHPEKRKAIGLAAHEHTKKFHTNSVRGKQILAILRSTHN